MSGIWCGVHRTWCRGCWVQGLRRLFVSALWLLALAGISAAAVENADRIRLVIRAAVDWVRRAAG
jgi:hypothetical protein